MPDRSHPLDILVRKRDGNELTPSEIHTFVQAVVHREVTDAQTSSFLMAVFQRGLTLPELAALTDAMRHSGKVLTAPPGTVIVDKHSTGGVGDKTSLLIAPILAAAADEALAHPERNLPPLAVPMISGRALGHTGGTLDKLEAIPGFRTELSLHEIAALLPHTHAVLVGQTPDLVPADRILYALRDHTGTVESPFLIAASIMSKKLAEGLHGLVLDVKVGSGAFMPTYAASRQLAELLVATGVAAGTRTVALLTSMDQPLGRFAGNWLEVQECVDLLQGRLHPLSADLLELSLTLGGHLLHLAGHATSPEEGYPLAADLLHSGKAYAAWLRIVQAQGGDTGVFTDGTAFHRPRATCTLYAPRAACLASMHCKQVGRVVQRLGAGRSRPENSVSAHAGLEFHAKVGDFLEAGQPVATLFTDDPALLQPCHDLLQDALQWSSTPPVRTPLVYEVLAG